MCAFVSENKLRSFVSAGDFVRGYLRFARFSTLKVQRAEHAQANPDVKASKLFFHAIKPNFCPFIGRVARYTSSSMPKNASKIKVILNFIKVQTTSSLDVEYRALNAKKKNHPKAFWL